MGETPCPNCRGSFETVTLEALYGRVLVVEVCEPCQGLWFDHGENLQLSARGTLDLFKVIGARQRGARHPLGERLECPRCRTRLILTHDQQRTTKFQYHRCPRRHGRFITFFQFLRERNFVRTLSPREREALRAHVRQVQCSNCGAPVDLEHDEACRYCRAPVSMLDPDQLQRALADLQAADARRRRVDPALPLTLAIERLRTERVFAEASRPETPMRTGTLMTSPSTGLVETGLDLLVRACSGDGW